MTKTALLALSLSAFLFACGPATPEATTPIGVSAPPTTPPGAPSATPSATPAPVTSATPASASPTVWSKDLTQDQQMALMKTQVMPHMAPVFQAANAKRYADFSCKTCHGPNGKPPMEFLPHLTMQGGKMLDFVQNPDVSKFMASRVVPEMAAAMGAKPYDPATKTGFGCAGCHTVDMK